MHLALLLIALAGSLLFGVAPAAASGALSGAAELRYAHYEGEEAGKQVAEGSHFTQQYSLLYRKSGLLKKGRGGHYDISLGGEWNAIDSEIRNTLTDVDSETDITTAKILYNGDVLIAPGGLPFRLHLYSRDDKKSLLLHDPQSSGGGTDGTGLGLGNILRPEILGDISNGQLVNTGATLVVGIRNGSYRGRYRDILSMLPRLFVDYNERYIRDTKSRTPQHSRDRNLAFVSLNKKDNWFHYRLQEYVDFLNEENDFTRKSFMLGTVDQAMQRRWINLTNWVKVSADIGFADEVRNDPNDPGERRYDVNLFASARRTNWQASTFNTFTRVDDVTSLKKRLETPFFANGELDRNTAWRFRFIGNRHSEMRPFEVDQSSSDDDIVFASARVDTFRQRRYIVAPQLEMELKRGDDGEGYAARAGVEFFSNRVYRPRFDLFAAYSLANFAGTSRTGLDVDFWENKLVARVEGELTPRLRLGMEEELVYGTGTLDRSVSAYLSPESDQGFSLADAAVTQRDGTVYRNTLSAFVEHTTPWRLSNRVAVDYDILSIDDGKQDSLSLQHSLRYSVARMRVAMTNQFTEGANAETGVSDGGDFAAGAGEGSKSFSHSTSLRYLPARNLEGRVNFEYDRFEVAGSYRSQWEFSQDLRYRYFAVNGIVRKLFEVGEEIEYKRYAGERSDQTSTAFTLIGEYYPTKWLVLGAHLGYRTEDIGFERDGYFGTFNTGLNFQKLKVSLDYSYGERSAGGGYAERKDHRWEVKVKKIF